VQLGSRLAMRTLGVDLASRPKSTAACLIEWQAGRAYVEQLELGVDDDRLVRLCERVEKVGLDIPFGWPDAFVAAVAAHHGREPWPVAENRELRFRRTDLFVWDQTGRPPLSVSTDKIGIPAFRAARLLARWEADRSGAGRFVEVYPRAARDRFGLGRTRSINEVQDRASWLVLDANTLNWCEASADCFDALIASLVARASALGLCDPAPEPDRELARLEGWIALPIVGSLDRLVS
jgi:predicted nuclease with RNAse H fold